MASIELGNGGHQEFETVAANKTLDEGDSGIVQNVTATCTVTLPATAGAATYPIRVGKEGIVVTVAPAAADKIMGNGFTSADNKAAIATNQPSGSFVVLRGGHTDGYNVERVLGTWTRQA